MSYKYMVTACALLVGYTSILYSTWTVNTGSSSTTRTYPVREKLFEEKPSKDDVISGRFRHRYQTLNKACPPHAATSKDWKRLRLTQTFALKPNHIFMCQVPKAGTTTWRQVWQQAHKLNNVTLEVLNKTLAFVTRLRMDTRNWIRKKGPEVFKNYEKENLNLWNQKSTFQGYHRAITVRHPFGRLISAWSNKFHINNTENLQHNFRNETIKFKKRPSGNYTIAWEDFALFVAVKGKKIPLDQHVTPIEQLCYPCQLHYQYIVKLETIDQDRDWLFKTWNLTGIKLPHGNESPGGSKVQQNPGDKIGAMMKKLSPATVKSLYKLYEPDFKHFGYTYDFVNNKAGGFD